MQIICFAVFASFALCNNFYPYCRFPHSYPIMHKNRFLPYCSHHVTNHIEIMRNSLKLEDTQKINKAQITGTNT